MKMCFELALQGKGQVSPNPMVGCVVLDRLGNIVSKGYHKKYGESHAERDALEKLQNNEAEGGTLYVNLEPCSHYGKTPPCVDLIIERKLKKVERKMENALDGLSPEQMQKYKSELETKLKEIKSKIDNLTIKDIKDSAQGAINTIKQNITNLSHKVSSLMNNSGN